MSEYKRVEDVLKKLEYREGVLGLVEPRHHPVSKYKKLSIDKKGKDRPSLKVGSKLVYPIRRRRWGSNNSIAGYALGVVLDWEGDDNGYWSSVTVIVQVVKVSNHEFEHFVGKLRHLSVGGWCLDEVKFTPEEVKKEDYGL